MTATTWAFLVQGSAVMLTVITWAFLWEGNPCTRHAEASIMRGPASTAQPRTALSTDELVTMTEKHAKKLDPVGFAYHNSQHETNPKHT